MKYEIFRSVDSGVNWEKVGESASGSYFDSTTASGIDYQYKVRRIIGSIKGNFSDPITSYSVDPDADTFRDNIENQTGVVSNWTDLNYRFRVFNETMDSPKWADCISTQSKRDVTTNLISGQIETNKNSGLDFQDQLDQTPSGTYPGSQAFWGSVLMEDGRVFCIPFKSTTARIYDPILDTVTIPNGTYPGNDAFTGGVLLKDGRVFLFPRTSTTARIYDPVNDVTTIPSGTFMGQQYGGWNGCLTPDGRVVIPQSYGNTYLYNPVNDTVATRSTAYNHTAALLLRSGLVLLFPNVCEIYDPENNSVSSTGFVSLSTSYRYAVELQNGDILIIPADSEFLHIIKKDFSEIINTNLNVNVNGWTCASVILMPNGKVAMLPYSTWGTLPIKLYDPITNSVQVSTINLGSSGQFSGGCLLDNGKIFTCPHDSTSARVFKARIRWSDNINKRMSKT